MTRVTANVRSTVRCRGCGAPVDRKGPTGPNVVVAARGCWQTFADVQVDELIRFGQSPVHRLVVDAYMAQHPGDPRDIDARQSTAFHLLALCGQLERGWTAAETTDAVRAVTRGVNELPAFVRRGPGSLTVAHVVGAVDADDFAARTREWALAVWRAWGDARDDVRAWLDGAREPLAVASLGGV